MEGGAWSPYISINHDNTLAGIGKLSAMPLPFKLGGKLYKSIVATIMGAV